MTDREEDVDDVERQQQQSKRQLVDPATSVCWDEKAEQASRGSSTSKTAESNTASSSSPSRRGGQDDDRPPPKDGIIMVEQESSSEGLQNNGSSSSESQSHDGTKPHASAVRGGRTSTAAWIFSIVIVLVGAAVAAAFVAIGVRSANSHKEAVFQRQGSELVSLIETAWHDFEIAGLWTYDKCRPGPDQKTTYLERGICSREGFLDVYESIVKTTGLEVQAICFVANVTHEDRSSLEEESYSYYEEFYPEVEYNGFIGFQEDLNSTRGFSMQLRDPQPYYYAVHMCVPVSGYNTAALDFDIRTSPVRLTAVETALNTHKPALTKRLILLGDTEEEDGYSVILMHPGVPVPSQRKQKPQEVSLVVVRMRAILARAVRGVAGRAAVYIYDTTDESEHEALFMGGVDTALTENGRQVRTVFLDEISLTALRDLSSDTYEDVIPIGNRKWKVVVLDSNEGDDDLLFVYLGGAIIFVACLMLAAWYYTSSRRGARLNEIKMVAEAERAALIVENAERAAIAERELNGFLAHEVRNPLAAAISACTFVTASINEKPPLATVETQESVREDVSIIHSSLSYINDLLRNMLDMHKVSNQQMKIELGPTDLRRDVLDPVATLLYRRGDEFKVIVDCQENLIVMTDRIRLKQVVLNLASNSRKFVTCGFIAVRAHVKECTGTVHVYVEDSGPGIPPQKRDKLFDKFQESLDALNQGTGFGLSLCNDLCRLMNGKIWLDEDYDSGVEGFPGSRFVVDLNAAPLDLNTQALEEYSNSAAASASGCHGQNGVQKRRLKQLPDKLSLLFVDDDMILRKLFSRSVKRIFPNWDVDEACNGETALRMVQSRDYDLIFTDQYMASIEKQMLGTETVRALRSCGVESVICGLSANDAEESFLNAGANAFLFKPFPCEKDQLEEELVRIYYGSAELSVHEEEEDAHESTHPNGYP